MVSKTKRLSPSIWTENASIQTKNCVAALSIMASIVFGSLVPQVWPPLSYKISYMEALKSDSEPYKMLWQAVVCLPLVFTTLSRTEVKKQGSQVIAQASDHNLISFTAIHDIRWQFRHFAMQALTMINF